MMAEYLLGRSDFPGASWIAIVTPGRTEILNLVDDQKRRDARLAKPIPTEISEKPPPTMGRSVFERIRACGGRIAAPMVPACLKMVELVIAVLTSPLTARAAPTRPRCLQSWFQRLLGNGPSVKPQPLAAKLLRQRKRRWAFRCQHCQVSGTGKSNGARTQ